MHSICFDRFFTLFHRCPLHTCDGGNVSIVSRHGPRRTPLPTCLSWQRGCSCRCHRHRGRHGGRSRGGGSSATFCGTTIACVNEQQQQYGQWHHPDQHEQRRHAKPLETDLGCHKSARRSSFHVGVDVSLFFVASFVVALVLVDRV